MANLSLTGDKEADDPMPQNEKPLFGKRPTPPRGGGGANPDDKRRSGRAATFKNAHIVLSDHKKIDCIARNVSAGGCMITVIGAEHLPDRLTIKLDPVSGARAAEIVWRAKGEAGLKFIDT